MPEVLFTLRWPDETEETCYSPSSVIHDYLTANTTYPLADFNALARDALQAASRRVEQVYGSPCSRAMAQLRHIENRVEQFSGREDASVTCLRFRK